MGIDTLIAISNFVANFFIFSLGLFFIMMALFLFACLLSAIRDEIR